MNHFEWTRRAADGTLLYMQSWEPSATPPAVVCLVHGHGDHSGRYAHVAAALAEDGYATLAFDHRGHGRSGGPRGHTPSYDALLDDVGGLLDEAARRFPGRPRFLYGQSAGGGLVLNYALRRRPDLAGVIATSPWLRLSFAPPAWKVALARAMNRVAPAFTLPSGLDTRAIARDPEAARAYAEDRLNHDKITARWFADCYTAGLWALERAAEFPLPLLLMHGGADQITSSGATRVFASRVRGDCTLKIWDGLYHETHNEPEQREVIAFIRDWLRAHMP